MRLCRVTLEFVADNIEHATGAQIIKLAAYAILPDTLSASRAALALPIELVATGPQADEAAALALGWLRSTATGCSLSDMGVLYVSAAGGRLHLVVGFDPSHARAEEWAQAVADARAPTQWDGHDVAPPCVMCGGYTAVNTYSFWIADARIATRMQTWLGGTSTSGQFRSQAFSLDHTVALSYPMFEAEVSDSLEKLRPYLRRVYPRQVNLAPGSIIGSAAKLPVVASAVAPEVLLLVHSSGPIELVAAGPGCSPTTADACERVPVPQRWVTGKPAVVAAGCGHRYEANARLPLKITDESGGDGAQGYVLTGHAGEVLGYEGLVAGSGYVKESTRISVDADPAEGGVRCGLKPNVNSDQTCKVDGVDVPCGGLSGFDLTLQRYTLVSSSGTLKAKPSVGKLKKSSLPPPLVRLFSLSVIEENDAQPFGVEELLIGLTLQPVTVQLPTSTRLGPAGGRLALLPNSLSENFLVLVTGDSVFLEGALGRLKANSLHPLCLRWCDRACLSTAEHVDAPRISTMEFNQYGALAEFTFSVESCRTSLKLGAQLAPAFDAMYAAALALGVLLGLLARRGSAAAVMKDEWVAEAKPVCQRLLKASDFKAAAKIQAALFNAQRAAQVCLVTPTPAPTPAPTSTSTPTPTPTPTLTLPNVSVWLIASTVGAFVFCSSPGLVALTNTVLTSVC